MQVQNRILMMLTSHSQLEGNDGETGVWMGEMTDPYYELSDAGFAVVMASPLGGEPPIDPMSKLTEHITASNRRFMEDLVAQQQFRLTQRLKDIKAETFDAVFIPGGHGPLWDLRQDREVGRILSEFFYQNKPIAALCHGPAALLCLEQWCPGYLEGRQLTAFTNVEETLVMRANSIPFELETALKDKGADFSAAVLPFVSHVVLDENLITGQNPLSASATAKTLIELLQFPESNML